MRLSYIKFFLSPILLILAGISISCTADKFLADITDPVSSPDDQENRDIIHLTMTLDNMGGASTKAGDLNAQQLAIWENYIDPEKLRVLVFDSQDQFLFESKNRWIKPLDPANDHSAWSVSIPLGHYGNDAAMNWEWDKIRTKLTTENFKIAVLANRPDREWNMGIKYKENNPNTSVDESQIEIVKGGWFGSNGPLWTRENSAVFDDGPEKDVKTIFDLHHCQYDPIYHGKNIDNTDFNAPNKHYYDFITKDVENNPDRPYMGATSSWVNWGEQDESGNLGIENGNRDPHGWEYRKTILPDFEHPIPMYGIQSFSPLKSWNKGTTIYLTRDGDKAISLLRSVVKLELLIPKGFADDVVLFYSNIYARCEPMDVWTPTDQIWQDANNQHNSICEIDMLTEYGKITLFEKNESASYSDRLSWFYGLWRRIKKWSFGNLTNTYFDQNYGLDTIPEDRVDASFPHIFNPCIQRNEVVYVDKTYSEGEYDHYVVYTGERNINDPSQLNNIDNDGSGNPTALYWCIVANTTSTDGGTTYTKGDTYSLAIVDYANADNQTVFNTTRVGQLISYTASGSTVTNFAPRNSPRAKDTEYTNQTGSGMVNDSYANGTGMGNYLKRVQGTLGGLDGRKGETNITAYDKKYWPLPLVRNHVYRLTLTQSKSDNDLEFFVRLDESHTRDINFK